MAHTRLGTVCQLRHRNLNCDHEQSTVIVLIYNHKQVINDYMCWTRFVSCSAFNVLPRARARALASDQEKFLIVFEEVHKRAAAASIKASHCIAAECGANTNPIIVQCILLSIFSFYILICCIAHAHFIAMFTWNCERRILNPLCTMQTHIHLIRMGTNRNKPIKTNQKWFRSECRSVSVSEPALCAPLI